MNGVNDQNNTIKFSKSYLMCLKVYSSHSLPHTGPSVIVKTKIIHGFYWRGWWCRAPSVFTWLITVVNFHRGENVQILSNYIKCSGYANVIKMAKAAQATFIQKFKKMHNKTTLYWQINSCKYKKNLKLRNVCTLFFGVHTIFNTSLKTTSMVKRQEASWGRNNNQSRFMNKVLGDRME